MLISIDGLAGSGKTTQSKIISTDFGAELFDLYGGRAVLTQMSELMRTDVWGLSRFLALGQTWHKQIRPALKNADVVLDGYLAGTWIDVGIEDLRLIAESLNIPFYYESGVHIWIDISYEVHQQRILSRTGKPSHLSQEDYQRKADAYQRLSDNGMIQSVDGNVEKASVTNAIKKIIEEHHGSLHTKLGTSKASA